MFLGFFIAFAIKAPMVPVHTWLPDAAAEAPPATAVLLVGVLDKVGTFGMIRLCLPLFPDAAKWATPAIIVLAVISIVYGALLAIGQTDIMRLIAYTSVSHFGFIVMGIFAMTSSAQNGATLYMVNHGFSTAAMFLVAAMLASPAGLAPDPGLRWLATGHAAARRVVPGRRAVLASRCRACPASSASSWCWWGRSRATRWPRSSRSPASCWPRSTSCWPTSG